MQPIAASARTALTDATKEAQNIELTPRCEVGDLVVEHFTLAKNHRQEVDVELLACLRQRKGEYSPELCAELNGVMKETYANYTATKCRALEAWLNDILASTRERPWTIKPTPIPETPDVVKTQIIEKITDELVEMDVPFAQARQYVIDRVKDLKLITDKVVMERAEAATRRMTEIIQDQLVEASFYKEFAAFRNDLSTYPFAVMKGPVIQNTRKLKWVPGKREPEFVYTHSLVVNRVSPFDFYWAPWATNPNQGFVIELMRLTHRALYDCIGLPGFDDSKIRLALTENENGHKETVAVASERAALENAQTTLTKDTNTIDVLDYWGNVKGEVLRKWGVKDIEDDLKYYEVNAWVVNGICIRAVLNPDPSGSRPFYVTSFEKVAGSFIGRSIPMLMRTHQDIMNSAYRALRRNMGLASGPFAEVDSERIADGQPPNEILPTMVKLVTPDLTGGGHSAYRFHNIQSHISELLAAIDHEVKVCDDATGIPAYSYGNAQTSGAGRTVGGLAMLMGNAAKGVKDVISHIEHDVLEPMITQFYNYNMKYHPDASAKVDAQVMARGPTGIVMREATTQRRLEALTLVTPYVQMGIVPTSGLAVLLRESLRGLELPVDDIIPDPNTQKELAQAAQAAQAAQTGQPQTSELPPELTGQPQPMGQGQAPQVPGKVGEGTIPTRVIDGRSGATNAALAVMQQPLG